VFINWFSRTGNNYQVGLKPYVYIKRSILELFNKIVYLTLGQALVLIKEKGLYQSKSIIALTYSLNLLKIQPIQIHLAPSKYTLSAI
jgi:hypothetical protein